MSIPIKTEEQLKLMEEGGKKLALVKKMLLDSVNIGENAHELDKKAEEMIRKQGGEPSFKMVRDYKWSTCVNVGAGVVHGIPKKEIIFKNGDVVSIDVGMYYKGFHTDTSFSVGLGVNEDISYFLRAGKETLNLAIKKAKPGRRIYDISRAIEENLTMYKYSPIRALVGHGVGRDLHEEPQIPCFAIGKYEDSPEIKEGMTLAIEVMYSMGSPDVKLDSDGWTISTRDGKISALFEETIIVTKNRQKVLTAS